MQRTRRARVLVLGAHVGGALAIAFCELNGDRAALDARAIELLHLRERERASEQQSESRIANFAAYRVLRIAQLDELNVAELAGLLRVVVARDVHVGDLAELGE